MLAVFALTTFAPIAALASSRGRRNTALVLTAATIYSFAKKKTGQGLVLGAGSAYAWKRYNDSRRHEVRKRAYREGYRRGYYSGRNHKSYNRRSARR